MRHWLLSNTTYGTWLPGSPRGSVTSVRDQRPGDSLDDIRLEHDLPGEPWEPELPGLARHARELLKGPPIQLHVEQAAALLNQFQETATYRGRPLHAVAIMHNHFHLVVEVPDDPDPQRLLADFKAYGSRRLNRIFGPRPSETWWTTNGSKRILKDAAAIQSAIHYVLFKQPGPLVVWSPVHGRLI
jgi:REP element-mobilizing transposase RayT